MTEKSLESIKKKIHWGIDIGGSFAKIGYLSNGSFTLTNKIPTGSHSQPNIVLSEIVSAIEAFDREPTSIGLGIAGMISKSTKTVKKSANLPLWNSSNIQSIINKYLKVPVTISLDNDSNVFAIGSLHSGDIPTKGLWLFITLGTGIGGTIIYNGKIIYGTDFAGEFGHTSIMADGKLCNCGSKGCWEQYAGTESLMKYYTKLSASRVTPADMAQLADNENRDAKCAFEEYGKWLGVGMANLANIFSPNGFLLAGGIANAFHHFEQSAIREYKTRCNSDWNVNILNNTYTAGAYGAAVMAMNKC